MSRGKTFYKRGKVDITGVNVGQNNLKPTEKLKAKLTESERSEASKTGIENHIKRIKAA